MRRCAPMALLAAAAALAIAPAGAGDLTDADVLALSQRHCVPCHADNPTHPAFDKPPRDIVLETLADIRRNAAAIKEQVVEGRSMPLGNETDMSDEEREALGRWLDALK
jgi:uncharacterized membrane protein